MWIVDTKTDADKTSVEISAVIKGTHGETSWGWHDGESKIVVLRVEKLYQKVPISNTIIAQAQKEAQAICEEQNEKLFLKRLQEM